ncbi:MAG: transposase [Nitrosarchaeum sp.]|nr:transposase [Nitrosarchaeum sp.]
MKTIISGIVLAIVVFFGLQTVVPFPYGLILGIVFVGLIIWYTKKHSSSNKDSILNYRRVDPISEKEKKQNDEALRILEKKYIEEKISKEEYLKRKKEFEDIEYNPRKCNVCGSKEFEFVSDVDSESSDMGYYRCKKCGTQ